MFGTDRNQLRQVYVDSWRKLQSGEALQPLEQLVASVVSEHPEYHKLLSDAEKAKAADFTPEGGATNPFLHMGMHITLQEQLSTDRPAGISGLYQRLVQRVGNAHEAEHQLMECLGLMLWEAQVHNRMPDEMAYLECVKKLVI